MGTPDSFDGPSYEEAVIWEEQVGDPTVDKRLQYVQDKGLVTLDDGVVRAVGETRRAIWQTEVDEYDVDTPPGSPTTGYRVIVGDSPTGDFSGHAGEIAHYNGSAWVFTTPRKGMITYAKDLSTLYAQTAVTSPWSWSDVTGSLVPHATTHEENGSDELFCEDLGTSALVEGKLLQSDGTGGWDLVDYVPGLPTELNYAQSDAESGTTSTSPVQKLRMTTSSLSSGNYIITATAVLSGDRNNTRTSVQLEQDDTIEIGAMEVRLATADAEFAFYTHHVLALSGVHTFDIDFWFAGGSGTALIRNVRIILWKVED